jgi:hypothetical protein
MMIYSADIVREIKKKLDNKILTVKKIVSKRQAYVRQLDVDESLKYTNVKELMLLKQTPILIKLIKCKQSINYRFAELKKLRKYTLHNRVILDILRAYNKELQRDILLGDCIYLGKNLGKMRTIMLKRNFSSSKRRIDWDKSFYVLENIAKDVAPSIYEDYKNKKINRNIFIEKMRSFVYSYENPTFPKWLVDHVDDVVPYIRVRFNNKIPNGNKYVFIPTNFINDDVRSQVSFTDNCKNRDEIIDSTILGTRDKLFALCRYDENITNNYVDNKYF